MHEIVAQWCSGREPLGPPGVSGGSNADNFAKPLTATGFIEGVVRFTGPEGPGLLIKFSYDHPAAKVVGTGVFIVIDQTPDGPLYLGLIEPYPVRPKSGRTENPAWIRLSRHLETRFLDGAGDRMISPRLLPRGATELPSRGVEWGVPGLTARAFGVAPSSV